MADPIPIYRGQDFWVPQFKVTLQGRSLDPMVINDILSVEYRDDVDEIDSFKIVVNNWDPQARSFRYSDGDLFVPGARLDLEMGYREGSALRKLVSGEITELSPTFPAGGRPVLNISGLNILHRLRTRQENFVYENKTDSDIAREVAARLQIPIRVGRNAPAEQPNEYILQHNQYDIIFLIGRARNAGYELLVEEQDGEPSLYFGPSETIAARPVYELVYGRSLIDFQPTLTTANQVGEVVIRSWDPIQKQPIEGTAKRSDLATQGVGQAGSQHLIDRSFDRRQEVIADEPVRNKAEADSLARAHLERIAKEMVTASSSIVGLPDLRAGGIVAIKGVGTRFSGRYFITKTTHAIGDGGYTTRFDCRREELN
jgi:phage protein D